MVRMAKTRTMWRTILLCASLFAIAGGGLAAVASFVDPSALSPIAAIALCVIGAVLILAAPPPHMVELEAPPTQVDTHAQTIANVVSATERKAIENPAMPPADPPPVEKLL
jgi:hypothetical protein